jgi:hypothetical protein
MITFLAQSEKWLATNCRTGIRFPARFDKLTHAVTLVTCIQNVPGLNLGRILTIITDVIHDFLWNIQANVGLVLKL